MLKQIKNLIALRKLNKINKYINEKLEEYNKLEFSEKTRINYFSYKNILLDIIKIIGENNE